MKKFLLLFIISIIPLNLFAQAKVNNIVAPVSYFINHIQQLNQIKTNLEKYRQTSIVGISGMGKTQLARMYAYGNKDNYNLIWFIDCNLNINDELLKLAKAINKAEGKTVIAEEAANVKKELMEYLGQSDKWLLVFDNLKVGENKKVQDFINWEHNGNIIFCSQDSDMMPYIVKAVPFKKQETIELANNILLDKDNNLVEFLVQEFKCYPVLIVQGAQILNNVPGLDKEKYKHQIQKSNDKIDYNISLVINQLSTSAKQLLSKIALLNNQSFSKDFLGIITDNKDNLNDDIFELSKFALITNIDASEDNPVFEMHDVIAQKILEKNGANNSKYLEEAVTKFINGTPKSVIKAFLYRNAKTVPDNIEVMTQNAEKYNIGTYKLLELKLKQIVQCDNSYDLAGGKKLVDWFDTNDRDGKYKLWLMNNEEKRVYAEYLNLIGWYYLKASNYKMSIEYFKKANKIFEDVKGYEEMKANVISGLTNTYIVIGDIQNAQENIKILEQKLADSSDRTSIYANKARLLYVEGKYPEALEQINQSIQAAISSGLDPNALFLTGDYLVKSGVLSKLGKYQEALNQVEQVYNMQKRVKKETNVIFGRIFTQKAIALFGLGEKDKALEYADKAIEIFKNNDKSFMSRRMPDVFNPAIAITCTIRGDILFASGKLEEALDSYMDARGIYFNVYRRNYKNVAQVSEVNLKGAKVACKRKDTLNYKFFAKPQIIDFGAEHPDSIEMLEYCKTYGMGLISNKAYIDKSKK
ncbi:Tetratricopeptide repeat-containing protein [Rickettsia bellii OSU 85-389]|nr:tetratricopeptide repeat protein [Rickettsia bellii]ABV78994.1 Tetratricopeptide repeat-containing protein [Rickettsia bellii OSU 85-389]